MSADPRYILQAIPSGTGHVLDLGGKDGLLRQALQDRGYQYINLDIRGFGHGEPSLIADAHRLPFKDATLDLVVSKDTLEHFLEPSVVVREVRRVLKRGNPFIIWVPFMHPFHGDDFYRYTPLGLRSLLSDFDIISFESPLWVFTVFGSACIEVMRRLHLGFLEQAIRQLGASLDHLFVRYHKGAASFAAAYRIVARKREDVNPDPTSIRPRNHF